MKTKEKETRKWEKPKTSFVIFLSQPLEKEDEKVAQGKKTGIWRWASQSEGGGRETDAVPTGRWHRGSERK